MVSNNTIKHLIMLTAVHKEAWPNPKWLQQFSSGLAKDKVNENFN